MRKMTFGLWCVTAFIWGAAARIIFVAATELVGVGMATTILGTVAAVALATYGILFPGSDETAADADSSTQSVSQGGIRVVCANEQILLGVPATVSVYDGDKLVALVVCEVGRDRGADGTGEPIVKLKTIPGYGKS